MTTPKAQHPGNDDEPIDSAAPQNDDDLADNDPDADLGDPVGEATGDKPKAKPKAKKKGKKRGAKADDPDDDDDSDLDELPDDPEELKALIRAERAQRPQATVVAPKADPVPQIPAGVEYGTGAYVWQGTLAGDLSAPKVRFRTDSDSKAEAKEAYLRHAGIVSTDKQVSVSRIQ